MSRSNSLLVSVFVVLVSVGVIRGLCTVDEIQILLQCLIPYTDQFIDALGTEGPCNQTIVDAQLCSDYATIVDCVNKANVSRSTCRPDAIDQIDVYMIIPCKVKDFIGTCIDAPKIDTGV